VSASIRVHPWLHLLACGANEAGLAQLPNRTAPSTIRPPQGASPPVPTAPFKPFRIDPLNREPGAFPDPDPQPVRRIHEPAHIRESTRCAAHAEPAPQARNLLPQMHADER
ncbi:MAG TPA: hypothetical protein VJK90_10885, partial [Acetobacteraceae bacterium]|nr:hypothetical protein [Acetobacteraceae bacterium]